MSGEVLFRRACKLIVAKPLADDYQTLSAQVTSIEKMRVSFQITKTLTKDPNSATIRIYNLNEQTRGAITGKGSKVVLHAGYTDTLAQIFIGDARLVEHRRDGTEWITTIECADGARAIKFARISEAFKGGTNVSQAIRKIATTAKIDIGNIDAVASNINGQFTQGYSAHGIAFAELEKLLKNAGYSLSIQDGALLAVTDTSTSTETTIVLNKDSGLIGSPEMGSEVAKGKKPVLKARSLLQPDLRPGRRVRVESRQYTGDFRCAKVEHNGDTNGSDWFSDVELEVI